MVNGETYGCVRSVCYLGDTINGAFLSTTA